MTPVSTDQLTAFLATWQAFLTSHYAKTYEHVSAPVLSFELGKRYAKIVSTCASSTSVVGFVDMGNGPQAHPRQLACHAFASLALSHRRRRGARSVTASVTCDATLRPVTQGARARRALCRSPRLARSLHYLLSS